MTWLNNKLLFITVFVCYSSALQAQERNKVIFNKGYDHIPVTATDSLLLHLKTRKGATYQVLVEQLGIDVMLELFDPQGKKLVTCDSPNGARGFEIFEFKATDSKPYKISIKRFEQESNKAEGFVNYYIKQFTKQELDQKETTKSKLAIENRKNLLTLDIDHFWEAYDQLKNCTTRWDSLLTIQNLYFDRATDGLKDFIRVREWSPEKFTAAIPKLRKFYDSVRPYTLMARESAAPVNEAFDKFKALYENFEPFNVCFAVGWRNTGGTVSDKFVLLGAEMVTAGKDVDYSGIISNWKPDVTRKEIDIASSVRGIVAHECVHTQQVQQPNKTAVECNQLYYCLREGAANFIGELISGDTNYGPTNRYGDEHEVELWTEFKSSLCRPQADLWMYNGESSKDRPADLGYYIGYKICQAYYNNTTDKKAAIRAIIEMNDPLAFLIKSGYDRQVKK